MPTKHEIETAFGRPARWIAALPAAIVGCGAFLLAVYGTWVMPAGLRTQYVKALEQARADYQRLATSNSSSVNWKIGESAGELDVIYSRLIGLEGVDAGRYWEWAEFLQAHAATVTRKIQSPAASVQPDVRTRLLEQAQQFENKSHEIFEQLAAGKSDLRASAVVRVTRQKYDQGLADYGVRQPAALAAGLRAVLDNPSATNSVNPSANAGHGKLDAAQLAEARLLLVKLLLEAAWHGNGASRLTVDGPMLREAWELFQDYQPSTGEADEEIQWRSLGRLLSALGGQPWSDNPATPDVFSTATSPTTANQITAAGTRLLDWHRELAELQLAAVKADWKEISFSLSRNSDQRPAAVTTDLARTICRLACSPWAQQPSPWAEQSEMGLLLVAQAAPHLPEFSELIWECGRRQAGLADSPVQLSPHIPEIIARGQSAALKHSVSALSATLAGQPSVARTHLDLIRRARGGLGLIARAALWRAQLMTPPAQESTATTATVEPTEQAEELDSLTVLMTAVTQLEPDSGLNWFTLGTLQFRAEQFDAMRVSLKRASELLGDAPAIQQMLDAAGGQGH